MEQTVLSDVYGLSILGAVKALVGNLEAAWLLKPHNLVVRWF